MTRAPRAWRADPYTDALRTGRGPLFLRRADGWLLPLEVERWCADADAADLDGAGALPGCRCSTSAAAPAGWSRRSPRGAAALGIDVSPAAVARTVRLGGSALCRSVFDPLPRRGQLGHRPAHGRQHRHRRRPPGPARPGGPTLSPMTALLIAETAPLDVDERVQVRVYRRQRAGPAFPWARVGTQALLDYAESAGWAADEAELWTVAGRAFVALRRS